MLARESTLSEVIFDLPNLQQQIQNLEAKSAQPVIWSDPSSANQDLRRLSRLKDILTAYQALRKTERDISELYDKLRQEPSPDLEQDHDQMAGTSPNDLERCDLDRHTRGE